MLGLSGDLETQNFFRAKKSCAVRMKSEHVELGEKLKGMVEGQLNNFSLTEIHLTFFRVK